MKITKIVDTFVREFLYIDYLMWSTIYFNLNIFTLDFIHKNIFLIVYFGIYFWRRFTKFYNHWYSDEYSDFTIALAVGIIVGLNYDQLSIFHVFSFIAFQFNYKLWSLISIFTFNIDILFFLVIFREFGLETLERLRFWHALGFYKIKQYLDLKNIKIDFSEYTYNYICLFGIILIYVLIIISLLI